MKLRAFVFKPLLVLFGAIALGGGCTRSPDGSSNKLSLKIELAGEPASLDPTLAEDGASLKVLCNTMEGLVGYDGAGRLVLMMAESYTVSKDGRRYDFVLRPTARWSDGQPVTAQNFVISFRRALSPQSGARLAGIFFPIRGAREMAEGTGQAANLAVRDEKGHLIIELKEPAPYFIQSLSVPVALPERLDILEAHGGRWPEDAPVTGAYRIVRHEMDRRIIFEKNANYWQPTADFPDVEMIVVDDETTGLNLFEHGELDILSRVSAVNLQRLRRKPGVVHTDPFLATYYLSFNFRKPPFDDVIWRRAVSGSVRREEITQALAGGEVPARSWIPPGLEGAIAYSDPANAFGPALAEARKRGVPPGGPLSAAFDTSARNQLVMEKVQQDLKQQLGLSISLSNMDWKTYLKTVHTDPPPLFRLGILSPFMDPIQILEAFTTNDPNNYLKWSNADYDRLVHEIGALKPSPAREAKIIEAQRLLVDREAIVVPIYHYVQNHAVGTRVAGFRVNAFGVIRFGELRRQGP